MSLLPRINERAPSILARVRVESTEGAGLLRRLGRSLAFWEASPAFSRATWGFSASRMASEKSS
eukprot:2137813-Pyramimonas_sp.AAC.1